MVYCDGCGLKKCSHCNPPKLTDEPALPDVVRLELFDDQGKRRPGMTGWYFRFGTPLYGPYDTDTLAKQALARKHEETPI